MKYYLANNKEAAEAMSYLVKLTKEEKIVDIKAVKPKRSLAQNNYLYLLLGAFGAHFGYTLEESKEIYKRVLNPDIYVYEREVRGKKWEFTRSSADLNKEEMMKSIDKLREWSRAAGYPLPTATDQDWLRSLENEIERNSYYL